MTDIQKNGLVPYLLANRAFVAPAVEQAVGAMDLSGRTRLLDAGTGAGGGLVALARAAGPGARVLAVDRNADVLDLAREHARAEGVSDRVQVRAADLVDVLDEAAGSGDGFDAIWASDVVWPGNFDDPGALVARAARALAPGGVLGLFTSNYYQAMFLPGHSRLERAARTASELNWGIPSGGPAHYELHTVWMEAAGLLDVHVNVFPRVGSPVDADPTVRPYLENAVWPELRESLVKRGADAGLSSDEVAEAERLLTPGHPDYIVDTAGYYMVHPTLLAVGRRPSD
ncbi:class I SAM-dependent methyltransferase [Nocardiopsis tropica]|uniref:Class I SAM-dependent methyltransferase n=1 Tax=Nocardiopsis tropica TaxID=109330 RepID=A0ABU7KYX3_9ACTN|nr:class I SAM-dependent methyltransferase [Nocardiopsis umidischolae]MEE2054470.1 class I SAM-dependent methyltransferase [Nocardiopsis umidischolae]